MRLTTAEFDTPLGRVRLAARDQRLCGLTFVERWPASDTWLRRRFGAVEYMEVGDVADFGARLRAYFAGALAALNEIAVDPGGTPFQQAVWAALRRIPASQTLSYAELATRLGCPRAVRAVGAANGANPIWLVIPCHRVIGADGSLTGYAGGLARKRWLLTHERSDRQEMLAML